MTVKVIKPDHIRWYFALTRRTAVCIGWATKLGDWWYSETPGDRPFLWGEKKIQSGVRSCEINTGRLFVSFARHEKRYYAETLIMAAVMKKEG